MQGISGLLQSSLGPSIHIQTRFAEALSPVLADVNQLELAILNLATNARDAMPHGGQLMITADERQGCDAAPDKPMAPGRYICLAITDEGEGMDEATLASAVDPFFSPPRALARARAWGCPWCMAWRSSWGTSDAQEPERCRYHRAVVATGGEQPGTG
nr:hypothetical protein GCM10020185_76760 [Pseudomonas brassicacearum subsp. brassicacearum]